MSKLPPYINPASPPSFIDHNNPLLAKVPYTLETGVIAVPGAPQMAVWTIRSPDTTLVIMLTAEEQAAWAEAVAAIRLSKSGLQVVPSTRITPAGPNGGPPGTR